MHLLGDICLFIVFVYIPYWYDCTAANHCLLNDINFINNIKKIKEINYTISEAALTKFTKDHLWYMGYHLSALSFFDERISLHEKRRMVANLNIEKSTDEISIRKMNYIEKSINPTDCISTRTREFFQIMDLNTSFLEIDPAVWDNDETYNKAKKEISYIKVINDPAERALCRIKDINFKDEGKIQNAIVSTSYQKLF